MIFKRTSDSEIDCTNGTQSIRVGSGKRTKTTLQGFPLKNCDVSEDWIGSMKFCNIYAAWISCIEMLPTVLTVCDLCFYRQYTMDKFC